MSKVNCTQSLGKLAIMDEEMGFRSGKMRFVWWDEIPFFFLFFLAGEHMVDCC